MSLNALFQNPQTLPNVPKVVHELIASFNQESVTVAEITDKVRADQVLSAKLLRAANCAHYGVPRTIASVEEAVLLLGFNNIRTIVIGSGIAGSAKPAPGLNLNAFWHYSVRTAAAAKWVAKKAGADAEVAFTLGMMHAIGQLVMHAAMPDKMLLLDKAVSAIDPRRIDIESQQFGFNFHEVGAELADRWHFPPDFVSVLRHIPEPPAEERMANVVHVAVWAARADALGFTAEERAGTVPAEVLHHLGLTEASVLEEMPPLAELAEGLDSLIG